MILLIEFRNGRSTIWRMFMVYFESWIELGGKNVLDISHLVTVIITQISWHIIHHFSNKPRFPLAHDHVHIYKYSKISFLLHVYFISTRLFPLVWQLPHHLSAHHMRLSDGWAILSDRCQMHLNNEEINWWNLALLLIYILEIGYNVHLSSFNMCRFRFVLLSSLSAAC